MKTTHSSLGLETSITMHEELRIKSLPLEPHAA
jgi:hypothetical protein